MLQNKIQTALQNAKNRGEDEGGFTLIELLVVILIIGILAAIALPTFLGQSDKAKDSSAKSNVRNAVTQMESCMTDAPGATTATVVTTCSSEPSVIGNGGALVTVSAASAPGYVISQQSKTGTTFTITKSAAAPGAYTRSCTAAGQGGCGGTGSNGTW